MLSKIRGIRTSPAACLGIASLRRGNQIGSARRGIPIEYPLEVPAARGRPGEMSGTLAAALDSRWAERAYSTRLKSEPVFARPSLW